MMSLAYKEGIKIPPPALNEVISAANQDIRQVIHNLSMWTASDKALTYDQVKKDAAKAHKDMKMVRRGVGRKKDNLNREDCLQSGNILVSIVSDLKVISNSGFSKITFGEFYPLFMV